MPKYTINDDVTAPGFTHLVLERDPLNPERVVLLLGEGGTHGLLRFMEDGSITLFHSVSEEHHLALGANRSILIGDNIDGRYLNPTDTTPDYPSAEERSAKALTEMIAAIFGPGPRDDREDRTVARIFGTQDRRFA